MANDTIFAISSGRPPAAIGVIRISGPDARRAGCALGGNLPAARSSALRRLRDPHSGGILDDALMLRFDSPASATGEDVIELHCHGGRAVIDAVLGALGSLEGLRPAEPGEFTRRAFENGRIDLTEAEGLADLLEAETEAQRRSALALAEGGLKRQIEVWLNTLLALSARAELAIDYAGDHDEDDDEDLGQDCARLAAELNAWLKRPRTEPLKNGVRTVIAGPPNAGKSSLLNALTGNDNAIVTAIPGTTRDVIEVPIAIDGLPFLLVDTAGLRQSDDIIEAEGIARTGRSIVHADLILWLGEPDEAPKIDEARLIQIRSKADLASAEARPGLAVSAVTGLGIDLLLSELVGRGRMLLPGPDAIALNRRQWTSLSEVEASLGQASETADTAIQAELLRACRAEFDRVTGRAGVEDMLDALFGRFCLGK